ncbi:hypothetical protein [Halosegnis rubeus]|uniref:hypothetical protein n=1 Tax=Halosegnis rubeus TaxID=2212850 RepID=UPI0018D6C996|nr:hypothetical protein [Halosegnis rubeus]
MTNQPDPLDNLPAGDGTPREGLPPAPETVEFDFPLVSGRSREDLEAYGLNMVDDYRDFKQEVLSWLGSYGKHPEKGQGLAQSTLQSTHYKLEIVFRWLRSSSVVRHAIEGTVPLSFAAGSIVSEMGNGTL